MKSTAPASLVNPLPTPWAEARRPSELDDPKSNLTIRETEIVQLLGTGKTNKEIALTILRTEDTVKAHLKKIFIKLGVESRSAAVLAGVRLGIIQCNQRKAWP